MARPSPEGTASVITVTLAPSKFINNVYAIRRALTVRECTRGDLHMILVFITSRHFPMAILDASISNFAYPCTIVFV